MNLKSAIVMLLVLLAFVVTPSEANPKWVWIPDDPFYGLSDNATSRQNEPEQPSLPHPRPRPLRVKVRDDDNWNINQQTQNVIVHNHEHIHRYAGFGGGYRPEGGSWEEDSNVYSGGKKYILAAGQPHFERVMDCKVSSCVFFADNSKCRKEFNNNAYKMYDAFNGYRSNEGCTAISQHKIICCLPRPYCKYTSCRDNKYSGKEVCNDLGGGYQFTGHFSYATCSDERAKSHFSAYCCKPGKGVATNGT